VEIQPARIPMRMNAIMGMTMRYDSGTNPQGRMHQAVDCHGVAGQRRWPSRGHGSPASGHTALTTMER
jgi:hypothetical protein